LHSSVSAADFLCSPFHYSNHMESLTDPLLEPYNYLSEIPGKEVRSSLIASFNTWLKIDGVHMKEVKQIIQMLHNASLLIDDIEDNSKMRRGVPVAHTIYGVASTINCANYVYFLAMEKCMKIGSAEATSVFLEELLHLHRGQGMDIYWRDNNSCPTEEEYKEMVLQKNWRFVSFGCALDAGLQYQQNQLHPPRRFSWTLLPNTRRLHQSDVSRLHGEQVFLRGFDRGQIFFSHHTRDQCKP